MRKNETDWKSRIRGIYGLQSAESAVSPFNLRDGAKPRKNIPEKITVYDSTLRDGEQTPGVSFTLRQKLAIARMLDGIRVPQIEAGFPAVSSDEKKSVKRIARDGLDADILALSRVSRQDIDAAIDCDVDMILLFAACSDLHMRFKLKQTQEEVYQKTIESVEYARSHGIDVSFSAEDSMRSRLDFLKRIYKGADDAGACRIGITDTVGCASPEAVAFMVKEVGRAVKKPVSVHLHNDFGLALANAIAGVQAGAEAVTTTVLGIGERAGNVPLEQFVVAIKYLYGRDLGIDTTGLKELSDMVSKFSRIKIPMHHPWMGSNVFSHESGIHVAAVLNCPFTYECVAPERVGNRRKLALGKHSGATIIRSKLQEKSLAGTNRQVEAILKRVKAHGEKKGRVSSREFWKIAERELKNK